VRRLWWLVALFLLGVGLAAASPALANSASHRYDFHQDAASSLTETPARPPAELAIRVSAVQARHDWHSYDRCSHLSRGSADPGGCRFAAEAGATLGDDVTRLYRAVEPSELKDIMGTGVYRSAPGGTEGKYFFPTKGQAENFSKMMEKTGNGPYCITSGCIPNSALRGIEPIRPAGEGTAYFVPDALLPYFNRIVIHGP
jgi:hypothetical protein